MQAIAAIFFLAVWFFYFAGAGLWAPFSGDDLMNLHGYLTQPFGTLLLDNLRYWSTAYRPLGGLFYAALYRVFGFDPLPFRAACFILLALNLALLYRVCRRLAGSSEIAFLAAFLASFHAWFVDLYYSSGTVYDLLCFFFYFMAFLLYLRVRQEGRAPAPRQVAALVALHICALNAKEMAVTLPLFLALYELVYEFPKHCPGRVAPWLRQASPVVLLTGALTAVYVVGKLRGPGSLITNPAYRLSISAGRFLDTFHLYLNPLLYQRHFFHDSNTVQLLIVMLALALGLRSRPMLFGWFFLLLSVLPVAFIAHYSAFFLYIPMAGWALYAACVLVALRQSLQKKIGSIWPSAAHLASPAVLLLLLAALLAPVHARESRRTTRVFLRAQPPVRQIAAGLGCAAPALPHGARVLFVDDPFRDDDFVLVFLTREFYGDMRIAVDRAHGLAIPVSQYPRYDAVLLFRRGRLLRWPAQMKPPRPPCYPEAGSGLPGCVPAPCLLLSS